MQTMIQDDQELDAAIDAFGDVQANIDALIAEQKIRKQLIETYAKSNDVKKRATERYRLTMKLGTPALKTLAGVKDADVVALLKREETSKGFVVETYDSTAIKAHANALEDGETWLDEHGLFLTAANRHAEIKAVK